MTRTIDILRDIDGRERLLIRPVDAEGFGVPLVIERGLRVWELRSRLHDLDRTTLRSLIRNWYYIPTTLDWMEAFSHGRYVVLRFSGSEISAYLGPRVFPYRQKR